ncbi:MAG: hypothetical protein COV73_00940, partial [Candidatus Omnitrophica bacterium CG11_big_fil_rev_8_21_14_0_20_43_6]
FEDNTWFLIRLSGTENAARLYTEAVVDFIPEMTLEAVISAAQPQIDALKKVGKIIMGVEERKDGALVSNENLLVSINANPQTKTYARLIKLAQVLLRSKLDYLVSLREKGMLSTRNGSIPLSLLCYSLDTLKERSALLAQYGLKLDTSTIRLKNAQEIENWLSRKRDAARPVPGSPVPSQAQVNASVEKNGWDNAQVIGVNAPEIVLAVAYLRSIGREDMAEYLEYLVKAGLIRAGPFEDFLAAVYNKSIILSINYPEYNATLEKVASLVHGVGATFKFKNNYEINTKREHSFKKLVDIAGPEAESLIVVLSSKQAKNLIKYDERLKSDDQELAIIKLAEQLKIWQQEFKVKLGKDISLASLVKEEFFELINENGKLLGRIKPRKLTHFDGDFHRDIRVFMVNGRREVLVQERALSKDIEPGCFAESVGGHLNLGENYYAAVLREIGEEVGIKPVHRTRLFEIGNFKDEVFGANHAINRSRYALYVYLVSPEEEKIITPDIVDGIAEAGFKAISEVKQDISRQPNKFTISFVKAFNDEVIFGLISDGFIAGHQQNKLEQTDPTRTLPSQPVPFVSEDNIPVRYRDLEGSFNSDLECILDLSLPAVQRFIPAGKDAKQLAAILNGALDKLENLAITSNDVALKEYLRQILGRVDNRAPPIIIRVSSKLPNEAARYYNPKTGIAEIIFNAEFINKILSTYQTNPGQAYLSLAIRIFHELGHTRFVSQYCLYR